MRAFGQFLTEQAVRSYAARNGKRLRAALARGQQRFADKLINNGLAERRGDVRRRNVLPGLVQLMHTVDERCFQAAEAEIIPAFEPRFWQRQRVRVALPGQLVEQWPARIGDRQHARGLVERFARRVVKRVAQQAVFAVIGHFHDVRMPAACDKADERRLQIGVRDIVGADMPLDVVNRNQRQVRAVGQRLGAADAYQQCADQAGTVGNGDCVQIGKPHIRIVQRALHNRVACLDVLTRRDFRHYAAVERMRFHLRGDDVGEHRASVLDDGGSRLVA